jgi:hypothetical protein
VLDDLGLDKFNGGSIDLDETSATLAVGDGSGGLLLVPANKGSIFRRNPHSQRHVFKTNTNLAPIRLNSFNGGHPEIDLNSH